MNSVLHFTFTCFGCMFYHQSMIKKFLDFIGSYSMIFKLDFSNISYSRKHLCIHYDLLLQCCTQHCPLFVYFCLHFFGLYSFCVLNSTCDFASVIDWILIHSVFFFFVFIQVFNKVVSFHNEAHNFLYKKSYAPIFEHWQ